MRFIATHWAKLVNVSIVIPTFHASDIATTLMALQKQTAWPHIIEILVVGQQSLTGWEKSPKVRYIPVMDRPTPARNRNIGVRHALGDWIFFTDSDCIPDVLWVDSLLSAARQEKAGAVCGSIIVDPTIGYWGLCDHLLVFGDITPESSARPVAQAATLNFGIRRSLFHALGGFNESFPVAAGEDLDFSQRLVASGRHLVFTPTAIVEHCHSRRRVTDAWRHISQYGEAVTLRRRLRGMDRRWRLAIRVLRVPGLLEFLGMVRVLSRLGLHLNRLAKTRPVTLHALPGVLLLDYALSYGMIRSLRSAPQLPHVGSLHEGNQID